LQKKKILNLQPEFSKLMGGSMKWQ
jgi:hypothetical protein